jgi:anti-sigma B factor antagonist
MNIKIEEGPVTLVEMNGDLDAESAPLVQEAIWPYLKDGCNLLLDMSRVDWISSAGLRLFLTIRRQTQNKGLVVLCGLSPEIKDTMGVTGFIEYFLLADTVQQGRLILGQRY